MGSYAGAPSDGSVVGNRHETCLRVLRGGNWNAEPRVLRSANRGGLTAKGRFDDIGFRVARDLDGKGVLKVAAVTSPPKPKVELIPVEAAYVTTRNANVRAEPSIDATKVTTLPKGTEVYVLGKTKDGDWLKVERGGKALGYTYKSLLEDKAAWEKSRRKTADQEREKKRRSAALSRPKKPVSVPITQCDRLAAHPKDRNAVAPGVKFKDIKDAISAIRSCRAAVSRYPETPRLQFQLGRALLKNREQSEAIVWYRRAAIQEYGRAQHSLGYAYQFGNGVRRDQAEALRWYKMAAAQGIFDSKFNMGIIFNEGGYGVNQDIEMALRLYREAAKHGLKEAQRNLGYMYDVGRGVAKNLTEAARWYRKAANQGSADSQFTLGVMYANGQGVSKNEAEAVRWYRKAAAQGIAAAQNNLGAMYANGQGVSKNEAEAVRWYRKAAAQGYAHAQNSLGVYYYEGKGVRQNKAEAIKWIRKAAAQGYEQAKKNLRLLGQ